MEIPDTEVMIWPTTGSNHTDYDVEWGDDAFILAAPYVPDTLPDHPIIATWFIDLQSRPGPPQPPETILQDVGNEPEPEPGWCAYCGTAQRRPVKVDATAGLLILLVPVLPLVLAAVPWLLWRSAELGRGSGAAPGLASNGGLR